MKLFEAKIVLCTIIVALIPSHVMAQDTQPDSPPAEEESDGETPADDEDPSEDEDDDKKDEDDKEDDEDDKDDGKKPDDASEGGDAASAGGDVEQAQPPSEVTEAPADTESNSPPPQTAVSATEETSPTTEPPPQSTEEAAQAVVEDQPPAKVWRVAAVVRPRAEFRYNRQFDLPAEERRYPRRDRGDTLSQRTRVGLSLDTDLLDAAFVLQAATIWGNAGGDALTDHSLGIHEAHFTWAPVSEWWLQAGRFELAYGDHRVLGSVGWSQVGRAWDGLRSGLVLNESIGLDFIAVTYQDGFSEGGVEFEDSALEDDSYLLGLYFHAASLNDWLKALDVYALADLRFDQLSEGPQRQALGTTGARVAVGFDPAQLVVEGAYQFGSRCIETVPVDPRSPPSLQCTDETVDVSAGFVDTEFSAKFGSSTTVQPFLGFGYATGDDPDTDKVEAYNHLYPTAHKFLGLMDLIGPRSNVMEIRGGARLRVDKFAISESIHQFSVVQPQNANAGVEFDTVLSYKALDMLTLAAGHALFVPGDGASTQDTSPAGLANWWFVQLVFSAGTTL